MKDIDIYDILNGANVNLAEIKKVELTDLEKKKIRMNLRNKRKHKHAAKIAVAAAVVIMIGTVLVNEDINAMAKETVASIVEYIQGNSRNDYAETIDKVVTTEGVTMDLMKAERIDGKIKVRYKLSFDQDISSFKTMGEDVGYKKMSVFYSDAFKDCTIYIDGVDANEALNYNTPDKSEIPYFYYEVNDVTITDHEIEQELVIYLNDQDYNQDMNIKLAFGNIMVAENSYTGACSADYTVEAGKYTADVEKSSMNIEAKTKDGIKVTITDYAYTNTGLKVYAEVSEDEGKDVPIIYFRAKDDMGNQYLFYPIYDMDNLSKMTFFLYDGPADSNNEYNDFLADGIKNMTMGLFEEVINPSTNEVSAERLCDDFTVEIPGN